MRLLGMLSHRESALVAGDGCCPLCGGRRFTEKEADETFFRRLGCLDCNVWLGPARLREQRVARRAWHREPGR